jgi:hypothetical protein
MHWEKKCQFSLIRKSNKKIKKNKKKKKKRVHMNLKGTAFSISKTFEPEKHVLSLHVIFLKTTKIYH